jgi:hypothetical protein
MIRWLCRWLRVVWPPWWALGLALAVYVCFEAVCLTVETAYGAAPFTLPEHRQFVQGLLTLFAIGYAVFRVWVFHPLLRPEYCQWLSSTPWTARKPLPLGPIHLVWQDVLLLGALAALGWQHLQGLCLVVVPAFLFPYLLAQAILHFFTGARGPAYAVGFGLGAMIVGLIDPVYFALAAVGTYATAYLGVRTALARFPWKGDGHLLAQLLVKPRGWPYDQLNPRADQAEPLGLGHTLLLGALIGSWFLAVSLVLDHARHYDPVAAFMIYVGFLVSFGVAGRLLVYCYGYLPPLGLLGRLALGRWIVPGYDQVFVAPIVCILIGVAAYHAPGWTDWPPLLVTPVAVTLTWWALFGMGPSLRTWRLTGNHRIVPGLPNAQVKR